ncbi:TPA: DUF2955 domain-containing protein [Vibrio alginolyticus]
MLHQLKHNDLRQMLRVSTGTVAGFAISKLSDWPSSVFFTVYPILLLGLVPIINRFILQQFLCSAIVPTVFVLVVYGLFGFNPFLIIPLVFITYIWLFSTMSKGPLFLFGAMSVVGMSIDLQLASYSDSGLDLYTMLLGNLGATVLSVLIACLMHFMFPDVEPRQKRAGVPKDKASIRHEAILCSVVAILSFIAFQTFNLRDSVSAQAATVIILFPLCWNGVSSSGWERTIGTLVGSCLALIVQLLLAQYSGILFFTSMSLWILIFYMSRTHIMTGGGSNAAFGAMTTFGVLYGQTLEPGQDLVFSALYRITSVAVAVVAVLIAVYLIHKLLNRFESTRHHTFIKA